MLRRFLIFDILLFFIAVPVVQGKVLEVDTEWHGMVELTEDIVVPPGVTLSIASDTTIKVHPSENTRIDPEYLSHQTEILVRGNLKAESKTGEPIRFTGTGNNDEERWAGIVVDGGNVFLKGCLVEKGEAGVTLIKGRVEIADSEFSNNRHGIIAQSKNSTVKIASSVIKENDYGISSFDNPEIIIGNDVEIINNSKNNRLISVSSEGAKNARNYLAVDKPVTAVYKDEALTSYTEWRGRIIVQGQLRLPPESRLIILPGTVVEFTKRDTNNDGIGENGLQVQGMIVAKGTPDEPVIFRSGEKERRMGDWDSINILGGDQAQNVLEYCQIEDAYRGLHFHFSNVVVQNSILTNNFRGAQFQESVVTISSSQFFNNISGIQARDSDLLFQNNQLFSNVNGANFFRLNLKASGNEFINNLWDGLRLREGTSVVNGNLNSGNRSGLIIADAVYGEFSGNLITGNLESGILVRNSDNLVLNNNAILSNGVNGASIKDTRAEIRSNLIADNKERGLAFISFSGEVSGNNITGNGIYAIGIEGKSPVAAGNNWWGTSDLDKEIFDIHDDQSLGEVRYEPKLEKPIEFQWPLENIKTDVVFSDTVVVNKMLYVLKNKQLIIRPATTLLFSDNEAGIFVDGGSIKAIGKKHQRIRFTSDKQNEPSEWLGVRLERAVASRFENCDFEYADWGLHVHFTPIDIAGCRFRNNDIGMKFRSGPVNLSRSQFRDNRIGLRSFRGNMNLFENEFVANEIGIFIREGGDGIKIFNNNIHDNERYDIRLGDFNKEDVDARNNWWGNTNPLDRIFDGRQESYIGKVIFEPVLERAVEFTEY